MAIEVSENEDGSLTISWDPTNPTEAILSTWTMEDFLQAIRGSAEERLGTLDEVSTPPP
jgi:hypothetical protein